MALVTWSTNHDDECSLGDDQKELWWCRCWVCAGWLVRPLQLMAWACRWACLHLCCKSCSKGATVCLLAGLLVDLQKQGPWTQSASGDCSFVDHKATVCACITIHVPVCSWLTATIIMCCTFCEVSCVVWCHTKRCTTSQNSLLVHCRSLRSCWSCCLCLDRLRGYL
jgi:hypothetical protein